MKRFICSSALIGLLLLTVPWWFLGEEKDFLGLPGWAAYGLATLFVFPVVLTVLLKRWWGIFDSDA